MTGAAPDRPVVVQLTPASPVTFEAPLRFATEEAWAGFLEVWTGAYENLGIPAPVEGVDYQFINEKGNQS